MQGMLPRDSPLPTWLEALRREHPELAAVRATARAAALRADGLREGFRDPRLNVSGGFSDGPGSVPAVTLPRVLPADSLSLQAGIEQPLFGGLYGGLGTGQYLHRTDAADDDFRQSTVGARLRLPLWRDRGYAVWRTDLSVREAEALRAAAIAADAVLRAEHGLVLAYTDWLRDAADAREVERAVERAEALLAETTARAELEVIAESQRLPARFEVALRREELQAIRQQIEIRRHTLGERLGLGAPVDPTQEEAAAELVTRWALRLAQGPVPAAALDEVLLRRHDALAALADIARARGALAAAEEELKGDLSLNVGATWQDDERRGSLGLSEDRVGYEIALALRRPLGRTAQHHERLAAEAELDARRHAYEALRLRVAAELGRARTAFESACLRLELTRLAVDEGRAALAAENERFALGEGTSRNVLDAQKELTAASRRHLSVAATVISSLTEYRHALGVSPGEAYR